MLYIYYTRLLIIDYAIKPTKKNRSQILYMYAANQPILMVLQLQI